MANYRTKSGIRKKGAGRKDGCDGEKMLGVSFACGTAQSHFRNQIYGLIKGVYEIMDVGIEPSLVFDRLQGPS